MAVERDDIIGWVLTTGMSVIFFLVGFYGLMAVNQSRAVTLSGDKDKLNQGLEQLIDSTYDHMERQRYSNDEIMKSVAVLSEEIEVLEEELNSYPSNDETRKVRNEMSRQILPLKEKRAAQKKAIVATFLSDVAEDKWPESAQQYTTNVKRITDIDRIGGPHLRKRAIGLALLGVLLALIMGLGMLGIFAFGFCGLISLVGNIE